MLFIPRTFEAITAQILAWLMASPQGPTLMLESPDVDLNVGSIERSHVEAVAVQLEELEVRTAQAIEQAILESCYRAFGFVRLPARPAGGKVVFTALVAPGNLISIPIGTRIMGPGGVVFLTMELAVLGVGAITTALTQVQALETGLSGNVASYSVTRLLAPIAGIDLVTNPSPMLGGAAEESDEARAERFASYVLTLQRGTAEAIEFAALSVSAVLDARVIEPCILTPRPTGVPYAGLVWVFCDDGGGLTAGTKSLVERTLNGYVDATGERIPGWKAAGVRVEVLPARVVEVSIRGTVKLSPAGGARWDAIKAVLSATAARIFEGVRIGDTVSYQVLSAALNTADPDVVEVNLFMWGPTGTVPAYSDTPLAADFSVLDPIGDPYSLGSRCVLRLTAPYPEWVVE